MSRANSATRAQRGFALLEILVALTIFAISSVIAYGISAEKLKTGGTVLDVPMPSWLKGWIALRYVKNGTVEGFAPTSSLVFPETE